MSIERNRFGFDGEITFECDECGEEIHTDSPDFSTAITVMKDNGWKNQRSKDGWEHYCPDCTDEG